MNVLIILAALGLTDLIVDSKMGELIKLRFKLNQVELLNCKQCTSFWAGLFFGLCFDPVWALAYACAVPFLGAVWLSINDYMVLKT